MGVVGLVALAANGTIAAFMFAYRRGDSNMRSAWICARNDAIGNIAVMLAATGVFASHTNWPDIAVAVLIGSLNLFGSAGVIVHARRDRRVAVPPT
jgi:Co/Zn/Cd efflux system component